MTGNGWRSRFRFDKRVCFPWCVRKDRTFSISVRYSSIKIGTLPCKTPVRRMISSFQSRKFTKIRKYLSENPDLGRGNKWKLKNCSLITKMKHYSCEQTRVIEFAENWAEWTKNCQMLACWPEPSWEPWVKWNFTTLELPGLFLVLICIFWWNIKLMKMWKVKKYWLIGKIL